MRNIEAQLYLDGQIIILKQLMGDRSFKARLDRIAEDFPEMFYVPIIKHPPFYEAPETANKPREFSIEEHLPDGIDKNRVEKYSLALRELADHYHLKCDWIVGMLHERVRGLIKPESRVLHVGVAVSGSVDRFRLNIPVFPETREEDIHRSPEYKKEWERIKANPKWRWRIKPPNNFELYVRWLCRYLFYGYRGERMGRVFPEDSKGYASEYIKLKIRQTASFLDIQLRRGRPPRSKKIKDII